MFEFADTAEYTHMPFVAYSKTGEATYFFCKQVCGFWKIFYCLDGETCHRLNTGLPDDTTECSPTAEWENNCWNISFLAGGAEADRTFYLYRMQGIESQPDKLEKADYGFYWNPKTVYGLRSNSFLIKDAGKEIKIEIPDAEFIYRLSYIPEDPNQLLITGQNKSGDWFSWIYHLIQNSLHAIIADGLTAYKCCFFKGRCFYASRGADDGFEERHIVEANEINFIPLEAGKVLVSEVEKAGMACVDCFRKHLAGALSYGKEVMNGHGSGSSPDHRADLAGELVNAEHHAEALQPDLAESIRAIRKTLEQKQWQPEAKDLDEIRIAWNQSFTLSGCGCRG